jgi:hypothetical protein
MTNIEEFPTLVDVLDTQDFSRSEKQNLEYIAEKIENYFDDEEISWRVCLELAYSYNLL